MIDEVSYDCKSISLDCPIESPGLTHKFVLTSDPYAL